MPKYVVFFWQVCWVMFGLSFFTSKSGLSIFSSLLVIISVFYVDWKSFAKEKWLVLFVLTLPLGMFLNLFSLGGWESSLKFFLANPWPLMVIPGFYLIGQERQLRFFLWPLALSLIAAMVKSASIFYYDYGLVFTSRTRVQSFFDIGRWGQFVGTFSVLLLILSNNAFTRPKYLLTGMRILFVMAVLFLALSNTRGPWLGFLIAATICLIVLERKRALLAFGAALVLVSLGLTFSSALRERVFSIAEIQEEVDGTISSSDASNAGRLHMWSVAIDFYKEQPLFGVGMGATEGPLKKFLEKKGYDYRRKHLVSEFSFNDAHSSYLNSLVQMGIVFFVYIWGLFFCFLIHLFRKVLIEREKSFVLPMAVVLFSSVVFIFYSSYSTYESLVSFVLAVLLYFNAKTTMS